METKFNEQDSLAVINEMINRARNNVQKGSASSMVFCGYTVAFTAVLNFILIHVLTNPNRSFLVWCLMIPCVMIDRIIDRKGDKGSIVRTQIDGIIRTAWRTFGVSTWIFVAIIFCAGYGLKTGETPNYQMFHLINPVIMLMAAVAEAVMAKATRFKPFFYGTVVMWAGAALCILSLLIFKRGDLQFLVMAAAMILAFVIPGHMLNKTAAKNV